METPEVYPPGIVGSRLVLQPGGYYPQISSVLRASLLFIRSAGGPEGGIIIWASLVRQEGVFARSGDSSGVSNV